MDSSVVAGDTEQAGVRVEVDAVDDGRVGSSSQLTQQGSVQDIEYTDQGSFTTCCCYLCALIKKTIIKTYNYVIIIFF